jgi:hypothetical protein
LVFFLLGSRVISAPQPWPNLPCFPATRLSVLRNTVTRIAGITSRTREIELAREWFE